MALTDKIYSTDSMNDSSLIHAFYNSLLDSFYNSSSSLCKLFYTALDSPQPLVGKSFESQSTQKDLEKRSEELAHDRCRNRKFIDRTPIAPARFADRLIAFLQDFSSHEPKRSLNCSVAARWQRQRSHSFKTLRSCRSASQEKRQYAAKTEKVRTSQNYETLTGRDLRAFCQCVL